MSINIFRPKFRHFKNEDNWQTWVYGKNYLSGTDSATMIKIVHKEIIFFHLTNFIFMIATLYVCICEWTISRKDVLPAVTDLRYWTSLRQINFKILSTICRRMLLSEYKIWTVARITQNILGSFVCFTGFGCPFQIWKILHPIPDLPQDDRGWQARVLIQAHEDNSPEHISLDQAVLKQIIVLPMTKIIYMYTLYNFWDQEIFILCC